MGTPAAEPEVFEVRQGRNLLALALLLPLSVAALTVGYQERASLGLDHWWIAVFPFLAGATVYRIAHRRVPLRMTREGVQVATGHTLLGLRTSVPWSQITRLRVTAAGLVLIELRNAQSWAADQPWLVRANLRTNERKYKAAIVQPLRELAGTPEELVARLQRAARVRVEAPEALRRAR